MKKIAFLVTLILSVACSFEQKQDPERTGSDPTTGKPALLKGGDVSFLTLIEQKGGKFYQDSEAMDCMKLLAGNGFNIVRLRLYNDPGNNSYSPSSKMYPGIDDEADILSLAKRARSEGLQIQLTFHYSDYWTNGSDQNKPHDWEGVGYATLKTKVYEYTKVFLQKMVASLHLQ